MMVKFLFAFAAGFVAVAVVQPESIWMAIVIGAFAGWLAGVIVDVVRA